jgi:putative ABC transport system substrate-binding protein
MKRRDFIAFLCCSTMFGPTAISAQQQQKLWRIGFLRVGPPPPRFIDGFRDGLREQGLVEGQHFTIEYGLAPSAAQVSKVAKELVGRKIDLLVASGTPSVFPARDAAGQIPVVFVATFDPVATGLVKSLAKPGGNITGMTSISGDLIAKRLQLVKELLPDAAKVAILVREGSPTAAQYVQESQIAAQRLGFSLQTLAQRNPKDLAEIFVAARGSNALIVADDAEFTADRVRIADLALKNQLPTVSGVREMVDAGGLIAYGASFGALYRRAASHVRKIIQGAKAADLPIEQPATFEFILNMRTAKALGVAVPPSLLARVDEVIE